jgi:hypothetical protein
MRHTSPREILTTASSKQFKDEFTDFVRSLEKEGRAGSYIIRFKKVLQSWLAYNDVDVKFNVNIAREYDSPTLANERVPSKEELDKILRMATPRARVSIALMAFSGLRPESLGNYTGSEGLRFGDLQEVEVNKGKVELSYSPLMNVRKDLSKSRCQYFTSSGKNLPEGLLG